MSIATKTIMEYLIQRLKEPSTWAAIGALLSLLGVHIGSDWMAIGSGVASVVAIISKD